MLIAGVFTVQSCYLLIAIAKEKINKELKETTAREQTLKENIIAKKLEEAEAVQKTLIRANPEIPNITIHSYYKAAENVGGDWFGTFHDKKLNSLFFWMGDVTGHGISSALITGVASGALYSGEKRTSMSDSNDSTDRRLEDMVYVLNDILVDTANELLMTMFFGILDLGTGKVKYFNAAQTRPLIKTKAKIISIGNAGSPLGLSKELPFEIHEYDLESNGSIFLYTDGLIENKDMQGEILKKRALSKQLKEADESSMVIPAIKERFAACVLEDDISLLDIRWQKAS
jgi:serine phosphatase RsbU (regulator of sigma subunit)